MSIIVAIKLFYMDFKQVKVALTACSHREKGFLKSLKHVSKDAIKEELTKGQQKAVNEYTNGSHILSVNNYYP